MHVTLTRKNKTNPTFVQVSANKIKKIKKIKSYKLGSTCLAAPTAHDTKREGQHFPFAHANVRIAGIGGAAGTHD